MRTGPLVASASTILFLIAGPAAAGPTAPTAPGASSANINQVRPVLLTTEAELERAQQRRADTSSPFHTSWVRVQKQADTALDVDFTPQENDDVSVYVADAKTEARRVRALAVAYRVTENAAYLNKARGALLEWAVYCNADLPPDDPTPSWRDFHYPGKAQPHAAGLHIGRVIVTFADAYAMLYPHLSAADRTEIERWFGSMRSPIQYSTHLWETADWVKPTPTTTIPAEPPWLNRQYFNNHLTAHVIGQLAIGYATGNSNLVSYALQDPDNPRDLHELFGGVLVMPGQQLQERDPSLGPDDDRWPDPLRNEIYDRYRATSVTDQDKPRGLIYSALNQRFLSLAVELASNNGAPTDYWRHIPDSGESLRDSYATYAPFVSSGPEFDIADAISCRGRYYENSAYGSQSEHNWRSMFELAFREYPYDPEIRAVIRTATARDYNDEETLGGSAALLDGELLDPPGGPAWTYKPTAGGAPTTPFRVGSGADVHFVGDWNGDGVDTPGWRAGNVFYLSNSQSGANPTAYPFGRPCDQALVGDWNGDGRDSVGVRRGKAFMLSNDNTGPTPDISYTAGRPTDRAITGDWNGDGIDTPGLIRGKEIHLRTDNSDIPNYLPIFTFARVGDRFVAGDWDGDGTDTLAAVRENGSDLTWYLRSGNTVDSPVSDVLTHGGAIDGAATGNTAGDARDELVAVAYR